MSDANEAAPLLPDLISSLSIPSGSKIPDPATGHSTPEEYDLYFQIVRDNPSLVKWSRSCLDVLDVQLSSLDKTSLTLHERLHIVHGILTVLRVTLEKWVKVGEAFGKG